ncbi:uncharacterized protein LOC122529550 [Frieseomelitta varia]|uniref:uncharacterized protein LOC122529550 n=1 Tax=Frieseomelitta varia TaxID=561572 RepID=UPI001CB685F6|nr:uncharacterized protein LOC122529550 [Frieseomelitta varia]
MFQRNKRRTTTLFDISYYKAFKKYLLFLGQFPTQSRWSSKLNVTVITGTLLTFYCPAFEKMFDIVKEDWKLLNNRNQACILEEITKQGNKIGEVYRGKLLYC